MSMGEQHIPGTGGASEPQPAIPPAVTDLVRSRGLGDLVSTRFTANPVMVAVVSFVVAVVCVGLMFGVSAIGENTDGFLRSVLRLFALVGCFGMVASLAYGIRALVAGAQTFYIYTNGVVHRRNSRARAFTWDELAELRSVIGTKGDDAGKLLHYQLVPRTGAGAPMAIPLLLVDGRDEFVDNLIAAMRYHGRPVN